MAIGWQQDFFETLMEALRQTGAARQTVATPHSRKEIAEIAGHKHKASQRIAP